MENNKVIKYYICDGTRCPGEIGEINGHLVNCFYGESKGKTVDISGNMKPLRWCKHTSEVDYAMYIMQEEERKFDITDYYQNDCRILLEKEYNTEPYPRNFNPRNG